MKNCAALLLGFDVVVVVVVVLLLSLLVFVTPITICVTLILCDLNTKLNVSHYFLIF